MSKRISNAVTYSQKLKRAIDSNTLASLLITATVVMSELNQERFIWFFALTVGYIIFDRIARLWELPHIKIIDESDTKKDVIEKQEYVRSQILLKRLNLIDKKSKVETQATLRLLGKAGSIEDVADAVDDFIKKNEVNDDELDRVLADIDVPFKDFLKKEENVPTVNTMKSVDVKFSELEILQE